MEPLWLAALSNVSNDLDGKQTQDVCIRVTQITVLTTKPRLFSRYYPKDTEKNIGTNGTW